MSRKSERKNLRGIREGQRECYEAVVFEHYKSIFNFMVYLTGDVNWAEDLTQEAFTSAWASIKSYRGRGGMKTWLHRIAYNKFIDAKRNLKREGNLMRKLGGSVAEVVELSGPVYELVRDENFRQLYAAMVKLGSYEYLLVVLHYVQGLSFREMARILDEPAGSVKWRISKALGKLRSYLGERL